MAEFYDVVIGTEVKHRRNVKPDALHWNSIEKRLEYWNGTAWVEVGANLDELKTLLDELETELRTDLEEGDRASLEAAGQAVQAAVAALETANAAQASAAAAGSAAATAQSTADAAAQTANAAKTSADAAGDAAATAQSTANAAAQTANAAKTSADAAGDAAATAQSTANAAAQTANKKQDKLGFSPVQQGGGVGQGTNKIYLGWDGSYLRCTVDTTDIGRVLTTGLGTNVKAYITTTYRSGTSWYRIWSDGWVEQGGLTKSSGSNNGTITLLVKMSDTNYWCMAYWQGSAGDTGGARTNYGFCSPETVTTIRVGSYSTANPNRWVVRGYKG